MHKRFFLFSALLSFGFQFCPAWGQDVTVKGGSLSYKGEKGAGQGKRVMLISGDDEYRSEEAMPLLARILSGQHGFDTTVGFSVNAAGESDPENHGSLTGSEALETADAIVMLIRFRNWDQQSMKRFEAAYLAGKPIIAIRTSTHPFDCGKEGEWAKWSWNNAQGGFGKMVLGETWVSHWGKHKVEGARGVIEEANKLHPILHGVKDVFGTADVYEAHPPADATIIMRGAVTKTLNPADGNVEDKRNSPMQPVAWTLDHKNPDGKVNKIFTTTMGSAIDFKNEDLRRMIINGVYWGLGMEVPAKAAVEIKGDYNPANFGFKDFKKGVKPEAFAK